MKTQDILNAETISTKNVKLICRRLNHGEQIDLQKVWDEPMKLEDPEQGFNWLMNLWKTPTGKERKNNPFGTREEEVLDLFEFIEFAGTYDTGNKHVTCHVPLWNAVGSFGSFQYYMAGGEIHIVG